METIRPELAGAPVIIGGGLAGLVTALRLAPQPVILLAKTPLAQGAASAWAQGGVAAAVGEDDDPALHAADTLAAGDGLSDPAVAARIAAAAPAAIAELQRYGVAFDRDAQGRFALGLEAAHGRRRIVHVTGDGTGAAIMRALVAAVAATPSITVVEGLEARRLLVDDRGISGVLAAGPWSACLLATRRVVLATGGLGGLYAHTTNPLGAIGQGVALAARAGAALCDMEFVQFHPTALAGLVDQHGALAAQGLADQRHGIEPDIERGGMELHELHVGQRRAGARRQRQPLADGAQRVGGVGVEAAQPAGGQHDRRLGSRQASTAPPPARLRCRDRRPAGGALPAPRSR